MIIYSKYGVINDWGNTINIKLVENVDEYVNYFGNEYENITIEYENDYIIIHCYEYNNCNKEVMIYSNKKYLIK